MIEERDLIAPTVPARQQPLDPLSHTVWLAAVLASLAPRTGKLFVVTVESRLPPKIGGLD
ncbi:hypothetical protein NLM33_49215 (plasmid) [Bradyrhizobium sp. CCGUVB1N3]|uniref:hypothetical protein n=1 Tax=Bradyrhizobium sp. CCGUVB1N3 TaxID=2949629 RepID=UPI0020B3BC15|nr:hypothetical protein [Bradyrhizobium sp. CCGUVB1N3]MCP3478037.1 hypothetical protein [Bradyrhizobium sp. CCGUVB1N3]